MGDLVADARQREVPDDEDWGPQWQSPDGETPKSNAKLKLHHGLKPAPKKRQRPWDKPEAEEKAEEAEKGEEAEEKAEDVLTVNDPYAELSLFGETVAKETAENVLAGMRSLQSASKGGSSSSGEPMIKVSKKKLGDVVESINTAAAAAAQAEKLSIAAAQAFRTEEVKLGSMKRVLSKLTVTN